MSFDFHVCRSILGALPFDPQAYDVLFNFLIWLGIFAGALLLIVVIALLVALAVKGKEGVAAVMGLVGDGFREIAGLSFRRIFALAMLTLREAVRRKTLLVFVVFAVLF